MKQKRLEREEKEKQEQLQREKQRRVHGKQMTHVKQKCVMSHHCVTAHIVAFFAVFLVICTAVTCSSSTISALMWLIGHH